VRAQESVHFLRHDERHRGWFLGRASNGVEGFFPTDWFRLDPANARATALRDYDAMELSVEAGEEVECLAEAAGWYLVRAPDGREGWIPIESVEWRAATHPTFRQGAASPPRSVFLQGGRFR
jgi:hypothetical protein